MAISIAEKAINAKSYNNDPCLIVTLDVTSAFHAANWLKTVNAIKALKTPQYLVPGLSEQQGSHI